MASGRIPRAFIDELLARVDIVDLIETQVPLKKRGHNFVASCPFHNEKTPSFSVNREKQLFYCFGCGENGNAIGFLMAFHHLDFPEAIEDLARFVGVEVIRETDSRFAPTTENYTHLYALMAQVTLWYSEQLRTTSAGKIAVAYLKQRGIDGITARRFALGFAPSDWRLLTQQLSEQNLSTVGLLGYDDNSKPYARFRQRLIFPIRDKRGRTIAFGGRVLDDSLPKYLNSPETVLFQKNQQLYGLYELLQHETKPARIILVEGYMDVVVLARYGIHNAVAALGTAVSSTHLDLLFRYTREVILCFDGDSAGQAATWKAIDRAFSHLKEGRQLRVLVLPATHDPDSWLREQGVAAFNEQLASAPVLSDYFFAALTQQYNIAETEGQAQLQHTATPYLAKLPEGVFKELMMARLQTLCPAPSMLNSASQPPPVTKIRLQKGRPSLERQALALLIQHPQLIFRVAEMGEDWQLFNFTGADSFKTIVRHIMTTQPANAALLLEHYRHHADAAIVQRLAVLPLEVPPEGIDAEFCGAWQRLLTKNQQARFKQQLANSPRLNT